MYNYPLNDSHFTLMDRLKICGFFLNPNKRWTQDYYVKQFQNEWANYTRSQYTVMTSSGSSANTLIAEYLKDKLLKENTFHLKNKIVLPSIGWMTSFSPFIRLGFEPIFLDVTLKDYSMDLDKLEKLLRNHSDIAGVFIVSLLGFTPDVNRILNFKSKYPEIYFALDNCENSFGEYLGNCPATYKSICDGQLTSSTSFYFAHQISTGGEGGMIFTNSKEEYQYFLLAGNHGMTRTLENNPHFSKEEVQNLRNLTVDSRFDFCQLGNNYRSFDIPAFIGLLDFQRKSKYIYRRSGLYNIFKNNIDQLRYYIPPERDWITDVPFALPIICRGEDKSNRYRLARMMCIDNKVEHRSIVSGNILRQTPFMKYANQKDFPVAEELDNFGFYVGLYPKLKDKQILNLCEELNKL